MVFWVLSVVVLFFCGWWLYITWNSELIYTLIGRIFAVIIFGIVSVGIWCLVAVGGATGLGHLFTPDYQKGDVTSVDLVAVEAKDTTEGRFGGSIFASYGYINGVRVLSFIEKHGDGGMKVGYLDADDVVIYEGDNKPEKITTTWVKENGWFTPWVITRYDTYDLHVPLGSVVEGYEIKP